MSGTRPEQLGRYVIEAELGRGSMGIVYLARDPRIGRAVALKTLHLLQGDDGATATLKERFLNEGRAAGRLSHRGVVAVYDADEDAASGVAYLAMELVEGTDLRQLLREGAPLERVLGILSEVADALDHAHARGVVHRDVKPANILIDADGHAHLTDFGIARLGDSTLTRDGEFVGTPAYMAPEQVRSLAVTPQTDVYALGVIAFEALTGHRPFAGDSMVATATAIATDAPPAPSAMAPVPAAFDAPVLRALSKEPAARQRSAGALAAELRAVLGAEPEPSRDGAHPLAIRSRPSGRQIALASAVVAAIAVLAWLVVRPGERVPGITAARAPEVSAAAAPATAPPVRGRVAIALSSPRRGVLSVTEGGRRIGRLALSSDRKIVQYTASETLTLTAGRHVLQFSFTPEGGKTIRQSLTVNVPASGTVRLVADVGTLGRNLQVKARP